ncbi:GNAT family N-acetyltransferase [Paenibacillus sp. UNC451MF]|uniref:GNAT family N-acetyltransferase n=1 Tax=Paenibacillus sp. UNC451MF TaxID=1449063 RepID=UPI000490BC82|nr:GNAT family N-acetyltransferase [Paenibacillus sp. UNC451MF]
MLIRKLTPSDAQQYRVVRLRSLREHPDAFLTTYEIESEKPIEIFQNNLRATEDKFTLGCFTDTENLAGIVTFIRETNPKIAHKANIYAMYVAPEYRKHRVGHALMTEVLQAAKACVGLERIHLTVISSNKGAKRLYESLGFVTYAAEKNAVKIEGVYLDEEFMSIQA